MSPIDPHRRVGQSPSPASLSTISIRTVGSCLASSLLLLATPARAQQAASALKAAPRYGRLVDVVAVDPATGKRWATEALRDVVIGERIGVASDSSLYQLRRDPASGVEILEIRLPFEDAPKSAFQRALAEARSATTPIPPTGARSVPPFALVPRDAAIELLYERPLDARALESLGAELRGGSIDGATHAPTESLAARLVWHSEQPRLLVLDPSVSETDRTRVETERATGQRWNSARPLALTTGMPAGSGEGVANLAIVPAAGAQPLVFRTAPMGIGGGMLASTQPLQILGTQNIQISSVGDSDPLAHGDDQSRITFQYSAPSCDLGASIGDSIQQGSQFAAITAVTASGGGSWTVDVAYLQAQPFSSGTAALTTAFDETDPNKAAKTGCFVTIRPAPTAVPTTGVDPASTFRVKFSNAIDPASIDPLENLAIVTNPAKNPTTAGQLDTVVATATPADALGREILYAPKLPLPHQQGNSEAYDFYVLGGSKGVADVNGQHLGFSLTTFKVPFSVKISAPSNSSRNLTLRFDTVTEGGGPAKVVNGQLTVPAPGVISGRPPAHTVRYADPTQLTYGAMTALGTGVSGQLAPLGARLMTVYRHIDLGLSLASLRDLDLDVEGLAWAPAGGSIQNDFFPRIRIDAAHSRFHPDEVLDPLTLLPKYPASGLTESSFVANIHDAANHPASTLVDSPYTVNAANAFTAPSGIAMLPYPNFQQTYTWRDTSYAPNVAGAPHGVGVNPEQFFALQPGIPSPPSPIHITPERPYVSFGAPSVALPLLFDFRTYPSNDQNTFGLNGFRAAIAVNSSVRPNFRVFSQGGINAQGIPVVVNPDTATAPTGGFSSPGGPGGPPGAVTPPGDSTVEFGRVDFAVRESRVYSHFLQMTSSPASTPTFSDASVVIVAASAGSSKVKLSFRGATLATAGSVTDARCFDAYGHPYSSMVPVKGVFPTIPQPEPGLAIGIVPVGVTPVFGFTDDLATLSGKRFLQLRITFENDIAQNLQPTLSAVGIAFEAP